MGHVGRTVWLKVEGRGTFQNSSGVKEFAKQMIQRGHRDFVDVNISEQKENVLAAHEALIEADSQNTAKFRDVIEYLRQELAQEDGSRD